jgi:3-hydroxyacyl-CoA dehydrogenase/enoyl-CoA hydratase/3-hydroxybutyryl-CoA epimerase
VRLGILPGFGGTQRLPRQVGLVRAVDLILSGRQIGGEEARRIGLVDLLVPAEYLEREALALLRRAMEGDETPAGARSGRGGTLLRQTLQRVGPWRRLVLEQARKRLAKRFRPEDYPAPFRALQAIEASLGQPPAQGLDLEARLVGELAPTRTARNLIWLFESRTELKAAPRGVRAAPRQVRRLAVIGAGRIGGGIASLAAGHGIPVRLKDLRYEAILAALRSVAEPGPDRRRGGVRDRPDPRHDATLIAPTLDDSGLSRAELVIEAVTEELDCKREVLGRSERRIGEEAVFATTTSSLLVSDIAARALRPERVVGLHFFHPVGRVPLVEVVAGRRSSPAAVATAHAFARRLGKVPVLVADSPGFLVNRILTVWATEAMRLLAEGVSVDAVDRSMLLFGMPVGPFALLDRIGLDFAGRLGAALRSVLGERVGDTGSLLDAMVTEGRMGLRTGRGFYRYRNGKPTVPDKTVHGLIGSPARREVPAETLQERLVLAMVNEAALCLEEGVVRSPRGVDVGMVLGAGFPVFRGGLLRHADEVGIPVVVDRLRRLADAHGERFRPAASLQKMVRREARFHG